MKLRYKIAGGTLIVLVVTLASLALAVSYTAECEPAPELSDKTESMKAIVLRCYGSPDVLTFEDVAKPVPGDNDVLVKVHAAAVNPYDWHGMRGSPYFMRLGMGIGKPKDVRIGVDFAGTVEAIGKDVTRFEVGDEVFGGAAGAFAEYVILGEDRGIAHKPANVSFEQAAAMGVAGITALQAVRDKGQVQPGQKVLINGASGGVGTFAVQIAKGLGAEVHGVCSTRNVEMVLSLGADHVFDYKKENYTESDQLYDVIVDMVGNHPVSANRGVLKPAGALVIVGGPKGDWFGPLANPIKAMLTAPFVDQKLGMFIARFNKEDMATLADLMASGAVTPVIEDRRYALSETADAIRYSEEGHARGKIIITME